MWGVQVSCVSRQRDHGRDGRPSHPGDFPGRTKYLHQLPHGGHRPHRARWYTPRGYQHQDEASHVASENFPLLFDEEAKKPSSKSDKSGFQESEMSWRLPRLHEEDEDQSPVSHLTVQHQPEVPRQLDGPPLSPHLGRRRPLCCWENRSFQRSSWASCQEGGQDQESIKGKLCLFSMQLKELAEHGRACHRARLLSLRQPLFY